MVLKNNNNFNKKYWWKNHKKGASFKKHEMEKNKSVFSFLMDFFPFSWEKTPKWPELHGLDSQLMQVSPSPQKLVLCCVEGRFSSAWFCGVFTPLNLLLKPTVVLPPGATRLRWNGVEQKTLQWYGENHKQMKNGSWKVMFEERKWLMGWEWGMGSRGGLTAWASATPDCEELWEGWRRGQA